MRKVSVMLCMLLWLATAFAQNKQVTGKVTDANGAPVAGISVKVKGARGGASTDASGNFSLSVPSNATLIFSGIGYETQEASVASVSTLDIKLVTEIRSLNEVIVTGTGT